MTIIAGLDVGGAHLKVAVVTGDRITHVEQFACPLWQGLSHLDRALALARPLVANAETIAITMTGELSDLFLDRKEGVTTLVGKLDAAYEDAASYWMGHRGFGTAKDAIANHVDVGSTNFLATAELIARRISDALLIDMGSTTTDIVPIISGKSAASGLTDPERLQSGELVYTGLTRTAIMGVTTTGTFRGNRQGLCREYLATMADVRRILGQSPEGVDQHATADGRGKSVNESRARLARMFGRDAADGTVADWRAAAVHIADVQMQSIRDGYDAVLSANKLPDSAPIVVAGIGADVVATELAARVGRDVIYFGDLANAQPDVALAATRSAPAVAVALLASSP